MDEKNKQITEELSEKAEKAVAQAKDKIAGQLDSEQMKKAAQSVADKSKETFEKARNMAENIDAEEINKNVKEIGAKTKEELNKRSKKEIAAGVIVAVVVLAVLTKLGWSNIFGWLFWISLAYLIYSIVKKKPKKKAVIAMIIFFVLTGVFADGGVGGKSDLFDVCNMTAQEIEKQYGAPEVSRNLPDGTLEYDYDGWSCAIKFSGSNSVLLSQGDNTLMGIAIGDSLQKVDEIMSKKNAVEDTYYSNAKTFFVEPYTVFVMFDADKHVTTVRVRIE